MRIVLAFIGIAACGVGRAADEPVKVITVEGVTEYKLANGARVLLFPEPSRPTVTREGAQQAERGNAPIE